MNLSTNLRGLLFNKDLWPSSLKQYLNDVVLFFLEVIYAYIFFVIFLQI